MAAYQWKPGGPKPKVDAQVFGDIVETIANDVGSAKPEDIVEVARPKKSPIHDMFEWQDDKAAELYRRQQARHFVGSLTIVRVQFKDGPTISNRAFFSVASEGRTGYVGQQRILGDRDLKHQVIDDARKVLEGYVLKFGSIAALGTVVQRIQEIIDEMRNGADVLVVDAKKRVAPRPPVDPNLEAHV